MAGIDVAKEKADVCTRLPPAREGGRRVSRVETAGATARDLLALAARLIANGVEVVVMEATRLSLVRTNFHRVLAGQGRRGRVRDGDASARVRAWWRCWAAWRSL